MPRPSSPLVAWSAVAALVAVAGVAVIALTRSDVDGQAPTPPAGVAVSALTCTGATLTWSASDDDTAVAFYDVYKDGQQLATVPGGTLTASVRLAPGGTVGLYVNGRDAAGNVSQASTTVTVTPPRCGADGRPPTAPTAVAATAAGTEVTVTWRPATDDTGVTGYDVFRDGVRVAAIPAGAVAPTSFTDVALAPGRAYRYEVLARDGQGNLSGRAAAPPVTTGTACTGAICAVREVAAETDIVWGLAELPDGSVLYNRRDAHEIVRLDPRTGEKSPIGPVPGAAGTDGEGGLLGLAVAPTFGTDHWLYVFHSSATDNRIVRLRYLDGRLRPETAQVLLSGIPRNKFHNGGRLRFGPDGKLYAATGDGQNGAWAQDLDSLAGKVLRLNPDGSRPADNPFDGYVWSYGHRNPQGLAFDAAGRLWEQEFGNNALDETNLITRGGNYGWPVCEGTNNVSGTGCATPGFVAPARTYPVAEGSCSGIAVRAEVLYVACLRGARLYRQPLGPAGLTGLREFFTGAYGRLRTVEPSADGGLWLVTSNGGDKDSTPDNSDVKIFHLTLGPAA